MRSIILWFLIFAGGFIPAPGARAEVPEAQAIRILIGEASGEGLEGMIAVAEVLRRRDSVRGFYGLNAPHVDREPEYIWERAKKAWKISRSSNITLGADHFESTDFPEPKWARGKTPVAVIGKQKFYKLGEKKK